MPATLSSITSKRATIYVPVDKDNLDGEKVRVTYKPRAVTPRIEKAIRQASKEAETDEDAAELKSLQMFCTVVVEWDLRADDLAPEPIPITVDGLQDMPWRFLMDILEAIGNDQKPDPKAANGLPKRS